MGKDEPKTVPGKHLVCRPFITLKNGRKIYAYQYGKKAFCFWVSDENQK